MLEEVQVASGCLSCIGRCGLVSDFYFEAKRDARCPEFWEFSVWPDQAACDAGLQPGATTLPFLLQLYPLDDGRLYVKNIDYNQQAWAFKKGIGPTLLRKALDITEKRIVSSVKFDPLSAERRSNDAEEMWRKMVNRGQAIYLASEDRFDVLTTRQPCVPDSGGRANG